MRTLFFLFALYLFQSVLVDQGKTLLAEVGGGFTAFGRGGGASFFGSVFERIRILQESY